MTIPRVPRVTSRAVPCIHFFNSCINAYSDSNIADTIQNSIKHVKIDPLFALIVVEWIPNLPANKKIDFDALSYLIRGNDLTKGWYDGVMVIIFDNLEDMNEVIASQIPKHLTFHGYRVVKYRNPRRNDKFKVGRVKIPYLYSHFFICFFTRRTTKVLQLFPFILTINSTESYGNCR